MTTASIFSSIPKLRWDYAPLGALLAALTIVLFSNDVLVFGFWEKAETMVVAYHAAGALCSIALMAVSRCDPVEFQRIVFHPYFLVPITLAVWGFITAPFAMYPLASLLGSSQSGEGALWYANFGVMISCGLYVVGHPGQWRLLIIAASLIAFFVAGIEGYAYLIGKSLPYRGDEYLVYLNDFEAYMGIVLPVMCVRHTGVGWWWIRLVAFGAAIGVLTVSGNGTAAAIFVLGIVAFGAGWALTNYSYVKSLLESRLFSTVVVLASISVPSLIIFFGLWMNDLASIESRHFIMRVMADALETNPRALIFGNGWGHTQGALVAHVNAAEQTLWRPEEWDFLWRDYFHSHNWAVEALYSGGLVGVLLAFGGYAVVPWHTSSERRGLATIFAAGLSGLSTVWFQLAFSVPYLAVAIAGFSKTRTTESAASPQVSRSYPWLSALAVLFIIQISSAFNLLAYGAGVSQALAAYRDPDAVEKPVLFPKDFRGQEVIFNAVVQTRIREIAGKAPPQGRTLAEDQALKKRSLNQMFSDIEARAKDTPPLFATMAGLTTLSNIIYDPNLRWLKPDFENKAVNWESWLKKFLKMAPRRTDMAIPYFSWLLANGDLAVLSGLAKGIIAQDRDDPVGNYFFGAALIQGGGPAQRDSALNHLRIGLDRGIRRFMPVPSSLENLILKGSERAR